MQSCTRIGERDWKEPQQMVEYMIAPARRQLSRPRYRSSPRKDSGDDLTLLQVVSVAKRKIAVLGILYVSEACASPI
jgi:hypothetical protein